MAKLFRGRKRRLVLDIGTSAVRFCELAQTKTGYQLTKYVQCEFNSDPSLDEDARRTIRRKAVGEVLKAANVRTRRTVLAVPGQSVFTRCRALPPVPEYKVNQIVRYEIQQQIPFGLDQIAMDYQVLDRSEGGGYEVMMAAIKVDVVEKHLSVLTGFKRNIDVVDVTPFAAYNWLKHSGEFGDQGDCVALIDLGATTTDIVVERENQFRNTRPLNIGGNDITQALAAGFGLNFSDAEKLKRERGFAPTGDPKIDGKGGEIIGKVLQRLVSEIMRSFAYFRSLPGGGQVNRVILCGGGACLRNIIPYLQRQLSVEVRIAQPLAGLAISPGAQPVNEHPEQSCVVLGLALRNCEAPPIEINLIPPRVLELARRKEQAVYWAFSFTALAMILASVVPVKDNENKLVKQRIEELRQVIRMYDPEVAQDPKRQSPLKMELEKAKSQIKALSEDVKVLDRARGNSWFWLDELSFINENRPRVTDKVGMWFSSIETITKNAPQNAGGGGNQRNRARQRSAAESGPPGGGVIPFGGIRSSGAASSVPAGGDKPRGGGGRRGNQPQDDKQSAIPRPNGMRIHGYATSDVVIKTFISDLEKATRTLPDGRILKAKEVVFSEASVQLVPWDTLYEAPVSGKPGTGGPGGRGGNAAPAWQPDQQRLFSFTADIIFSRAFQDEQEPEVAEPADEGASPGPGGPGKPGRPGGPGGPGGGPGGPGENPPPPPAGAAGGGE